MTKLKIIAALTTPVQLAAQHTRYKIIDLGTLGGTNSYQTAPGLTVNNRGEVIAFSDTDVSDPFAPNCLQPDCLISHAIKWRGGTPADLGALPGVNDSIPTWITVSASTSESKPHGFEPRTNFPITPRLPLNCQSTQIEGSRVIIPRNLCHLPQAHRLARFKLQRL